MFIRNTVVCSTWVDDCLMFSDDEEEIEKVFIN